MASIRLALGQLFVPVPPGVPESELPGETPLENVVTMSAQVRWLAVQSADATHAFDPGPHDPATGYPVAPFTAFLDGLLAGIVDPGVTYASEPYLLDHIIIGTQWIRGRGHVFQLNAGGAPFVQEARVGGQAFEVGILISVEVLA